jgi:transcriptional regulator with XRE-family HTH domain
MKLNDYLKQSNLTVSKFATESQLNQPTVWRIVNGKFKPSARIAAAIEKATGGDVTLRELLFPDQQNDQKDVAQL